MNPGPWGALLMPFYALGVAARAVAYDRAWLRTASAEVPIISVGGLEAGGTGKTPVAAWVLQRLLDWGYRPGLLTRGYGRASTAPVVRRRGQLALPAQVGDEAAMLVHQGLDVPVAAMPRRRAGAAALVLEGCDVLVMDDGFAHRSLARQVDIVVLQAEAPLGTGHLLPWGSLREGPRALGRAHVIWLHERRGGGYDLGRAVADRYAPHAVVVTSRAVLEVQHRGQRCVVAGRKIVAAAGVARPREVFTQLRQQGAVVLEERPYRDHHAFGERDVHELATRAQRVGAEAVVATAKDAVKLRPRWPASVPLWVAAQRLVVAAEGLESLEQLVRRHLSPPARSR